MADINLKNLIKGSADIDCIKAGGIAVYNITADDNSVFQIEIDLSDKHDVGETATFLPHYDKAITLMRWIRKSIDNESIIQIK